MWANIFMPSISLELRISSVVFFARVLFLRLFHLAQGALWSFSWNKTDISLNPLPTRTSFYDFLGYGQGESNCCISWLNSQSFNVFFSPSGLLRQQTIITIENDIVAGGVQRWLREIFYDSFESGANDCHFVLVFFFVKRASEGATIRVGSNLECVKLCNFHFCCAFSFYQSMKKVRCHDYGTVNKNLFKQQANQHSLFFTLIAHVFF